MNSPIRTAGAVLSLALICLPASAAAQAPEPEIRYVTTTSFGVPAGPERQKVLMWIDSMMVPQAKMNPNVLSYRVIIHNWGHNSNDVLIVAEYPNWAAIEAVCEACDKWAQSQERKAGTPERAKWDDIGSTFGKYFAGHVDEIYAADMRRSKK